MAEKPALVSFVEEINKESTEMETTFRNPLAADGILWQWENKTHENPLNGKKKLYATHVNY